MLTSHCYTVKKPIKHCIFIELIKKIRDTNSNKKLTALLYSHLSHKINYFLTNILTEN